MITDQDKQELLLLAKKFHAESFYKNEVFNEIKFLTLLETCNTHPDKVSLFCYRVDGKIVGGILGYISTRFFSNDKIAGDYGMFLLPEHRGGRVFFRLLKQYETWAKAQQATKIILGHTTQINMEKAPNFYKKLGYDLQGFLFSKEIN